MQKPFLWVRYTVAGNGAPRSFVSPVLDLYTVPGQVQGVVQQAGGQPGALGIVLASFFLVLTLAPDETIHCTWVKVQDCQVVSPKHWDRQEGDVFVPLPDGLPRVD